ncbi:MAG: TetR/AcrR family transcriptional regulator [Proteobacteria bacterium]|nr:TetR/AcrR family transcriptional regulator [Pseudomonadota bacterium]
MRQRATSAAARNERRDAILAAAAEAFDRLGFAETRMAWLAEQAGVAKGTVYLYFPTKEAVFLALYAREMGGWFDGMEKALEKLPVDDIARLAGAFVDAIERQPRLPPLAAILHTAFERNSDEADVLAFKRHMLNRMLETGYRLESTMSFLAPGDGARLLLRLHALLIGCWHAATPAPVANRVLQRSELGAIRVDFSEELENTLVLLLEGWRRIGGGF